MVLAEQVTGASVWTQTDAATVSSQSFVFVVGVTQAGKDRSGRRVAQHFNAHFCATGDLCRQAADGTSQESRLLRRCLGGDQLERMQAAKAANALFPDDVVNSLLYADVARTGADITVVCGYPRTPVQVDFLAQRYPTRQFLMLSLEINDKVAFERMRNRRVCLRCSHPFSAAQRLTQCTQCGGRIGRRPDDNDRALRRRLREERPMLTAMLAAFEPVGHIFRLCGEDDPDTVFRTALDHLSVHLR